jgi:hypothetical protein
VQRSQAWQPPQLPDQLLHHAHRVPNKESKAASLPAEHLLGQDHRLGDGVCIESGNVSWFTVNWNQAGLG